MIRLCRRLGLVVAVAVLCVASRGLTRGDEPVSPASGPRWDAQEQAELILYARQTWHSFELMVGPEGLPSDRLTRTSKQEWEPSHRTSPTDIAAYLWSTLAARSLALIDDADADRRLGVTLDSLARMDRDHGFFFNLYDVTTRARHGVGGDQKHPARPFLSSVDNGWLAVALMMVANSRPALRDQANALLAPMDFGFFYEPYDAHDPVKYPGQFHGGYFLDTKTFTAFYGMLNTEARILSYLAISRGQVPAESYYRLFRTFPVDRSKQSQVPIGKSREYLGVPVFEGHYDVQGRRVVPSWGGSMFEALMVPLFVPEETWAPASWGINHLVYAQIQREQGLDVRHYKFWGFSPSETPEGGYQTFGVEGLGTEVDGYRTYESLTSRHPTGATTTRPATDGVVTPHASFLALRYLPRESLANLRALKADLPTFGPAGFFDSVNITDGKVSTSVLSLDQGMIMAALANALDRDAIRRAFCAGAVTEAIRPLIGPEEFSITARP